MRGGVQDAETRLLNGECVIVAIKRTNDKGHIIAAVPVSASDRNAGYKFKILDPSGAGRGYDGLYKSFADLKSKNSTISTATPKVIINRGSNTPHVQSSGTVGGEIIGPTGFIFPVQGRNINNIENKNYPSYSGHTGVDIYRNISPGENIVAVKDGKVTISKALKNNDGSYRSYGEYIEIDHNDGTRTRYAHMMPNSRTVKEGDTVKQGQIIGKLGTTGNSEGYHLHFEVRKNGNAVNPLPYLGYGSL